MDLFTSPRQSGHAALWCDLADTIVSEVSHDDVAVPIHCDPTGTFELSVSMTLYASAR
jgi:hypothetical protein